VGGDARHAICPVHVGDAAKAQAAAARMLERGVYVVGFSYPVVPLGKARIRVQISAAHTPADIDTAIAAFAAVKSEFGI
jgi:glycine C-acetyltransferase